MRTIFLLLLLTIPVYSQTDLEARIKTFRNNDRFSVKYDKFRGETEVSIGPFSLKGIKFRMSAYFIATDSPTKDIYIEFRSLSRDWKFLRNSELYALADGERLLLGDGSQDRELLRYGVKETIQYKIPVETFAQLAKARSAELKIGNVQFRLKDEHLEAFRDLLGLTK